MTLLNSKENYGAVSRALHWSMAVAIVGMFGLGLWMVDLDYYSPFYRSAPDLHRGAGVFLLILLAFRFAWRIFSTDPERGSLAEIERRGAEIAHWAFYPLLFALMASGYFISTADGRSIDVFGLFQVPALVKQAGLERIAGSVHEYLAYLTIGLAALHALAAVKHHIIDRDRTLLKMLRSERTTQS